MGLGGSTISGTGAGNALWPACFCSVLPDRAGRVISPMGTQQWECGPCLPTVFLRRAAWHSDNFCIDIILGSVIALELMQGGPTTRAL